MKYIESPQKPAVPIRLAEDEKPEFTVLGNMASLAYGVGSRSVDSVGGLYGC